MHSPFVKQMLNLWSICNRSLPKDRTELVNGVLEPSLQLQWRTWFREEANILEQWSKARGRDISQDPIHVEGDYVAIERQSIHDNHTLKLCHASALNGWDIIGETGKKWSHLLKLYRAQRKPLWISYKD